MVAGSREINREDAYTLGQPLETYERALELVVDKEVDEKRAMKACDEAKMVFLEKVEEDEDVKEC